MTARPDLVRIDDLIVDGRLRPQRADPFILPNMLEAAARDLEAARANDLTFPSWAMSMRYEAGLRCARIIVQAAGHRIAADRGHVTAIDAADTLTEGRHHLTFVRLHRMRRMRHEFMYEVGADPSIQDLDLARQDVTMLITLAKAAVDGLQGP